MLRRTPLSAWILLLIVLLAAGNLAAQEKTTDSPEQPEASQEFADAMPNFRDLLKGGGVIGYTIVALMAVMSLAMVSLIVEHVISIRRGALMPAGLAEEVHRCLSENNFQQARQQCKLNPSFTGQVLDAGLSEVKLGYSAVEKSMEDAATEQAARLFRKIEYLNVIGTLAPMLGLMGTVWGMILAFVQFEHKANPQVADLAPGIYKALLTTLMGLAIAVPALASFALFRNRIDGLVAESSLVAEHVFSDFKHKLSGRKRPNKPPTPTSGQSGGIPPVAIEKPRTS
ncbi:MAG: MotA/TolQ/ExbB proton channel family protein [Planctomycetota bacterium]|nr:MotA/TolQ/ExbB proton channel family protein [Planctomycetota bacterium]